MMLFHELATNTGIFIMFVEPHSPAHQAGFQEGDVIVGFNDRAVATMDELHQHLTPEQIGVRSHLTILRGHQKLVLNIVPAAERKKEFGVRSSEFGVRNSEFGVGAGFPRPE
ncbi:MAG: PDZ domain-containing protein [Calothrix sp. MO_167.B12]|nr:PDZ domain-containing protein [Calothrix sp. MO_167.B12]